jgi:tetratricopeptide (TPR) repeat protein
MTPHDAAAEWPPESLTNLQVLPEDTSVRKLRDVMRGFAGGLGVRCIYCHVGDDPNDLASIDFASDDKIEKRKAREMIRMVQRINGELLAKVPERSDPPVVVTCRTCHHSLTRPVDIRDVLVKTFETEGADATIAQYQELREEYYGSDSYDFRHFMLANVSEEVADQSPEGAIQLLEFNGKLHPTSGQTFFTMAQIYREMDDIDGAIRSLERALKADPENEFYRRLIQQLRGEQ